jgi:uncharacterized protein
MNPKILLLLFTFFYTVFYTTAFAGDGKLRVLVFSKTSAWRHNSIPAGKEAIRKMGAEKNWDVRFSEDSLDFNDKNLATIDVIIFLSTTGNILGNNEEAAFKKYMANGGGFVGIHAATDTEHNWPWYTNLVGGRFKNHPKPQKAIINIIDTTFAAMQHLGKTWEHFDEWYNFKEPISSHCIVLASMDVKSYNGSEMNGNHPIIWYHYYEGGRVFYTGLGHTNESFAEKEFVTMLIAGIEWAGNRSNTKPVTAD